VSDKIYNVLFLCTGNSARSVIAECVLNRVGNGRFQAFSAGSAPKGEIHPVASQTLSDAGYPIEELRSKSWDEFAKPDSPVIDFVITLCDNAARETCPVWLGPALRAHWGMPDPAAEEDVDGKQQIAFAKTLAVLTGRLSAFANLETETLESQGIGYLLAQMGHSDSSG
jgi:arsenate reductase